MKKALFIFLLTTYYLLPTTLSAQSVDILYSGETYTPPFYQDGALWSKESFIHLLAIPNGLGDPSKLDYKWSQNGTVLGAISGIGRNSIRFKDSIFSKPQAIKVEIISPDEEVVALSRLDIKPQPTEILVYEKNPLYGFLFNTEVSTGYNLPQGEITFTAFPLFFSAQSYGSPNIGYVWRSNAGESSQTDSVTYRVPEGKGGFSEVSVEVTNSETFRQTAEQSFLVQFGNENE